ncbi:unnamed protein product [Acanthoscelides obtectus]|uniref:Fucosyltransferase N-terminal domain-containing protein n=1 Tax=Acanthoscelides obtectus TaxID=200917 RepID=A0A9P0LG77_ACAOB|nr:unnamed protein product [Acanthoscelides obtectus]CAK1632958.1 Alpha-(1,3)-fucosyltransferase 10 [Acanthoscelides obtectus]
MIFLSSKDVRRILFVTAVIYISIQVYFHCEIIPQIQSPAAHVLLWWTPFLPDDNHIIKCGEENYQCILTNNRDNIKNVNLGAILFYGSRIENYDFPLPRNYNIPWAIFHEESPKNYAPYLYRNIQRVFNLSSTFSRNSTFPVPLQYLNHIHLLTGIFPLKTAFKFNGPISLGCHGIVDHRRQILY